MPAGLDTARRTAARVAAIRAPYPGTDTLAARTAVPEPPAAQALAPVVHLADRTLRPVRDDAGRVGQTAKIDGQNRINLGKLLGRLWAGTRAPSSSPAASAATSSSGPAPTAD